MPFFKFICKKCGETFLTREQPEKCSKCGAEVKKELFFEKKSPPPSKKVGDVAKNHIEDTKKEIENLKKELLERSFM